METQLKEKKPSIFKNALMYGLLLGIAMIVLNLIFYVANISKENPIQYLSFLLMIAGIVMGILNFRSQYNHGFISYGKSLGTGVLIGLSSSLIMALYLIIFYSYIAPEIITETLRTAEEKMLEKNPNMTQEQIDMGLKFSAYFVSPIGLSVSSIFGGTLMSTIFSLIISIFTTKKDNSFESNF